MRAGQRAGPFSKCRERSTCAKPKVKPIPEGMHSLTPHLVCKGAGDAIEFYKKAFNAVKIGRCPRRTAS